MTNQTDQQLLRDFAEHDSEAAFAELVRRHVDLVHSAAFRMTGHAHSTQDVTQAVFVALAQNATRLTEHPVLSGWLHTTARNLAAKNIRATVRRQTHEQEATAMNDLLSTAPDASWDEIAPHLDAALGELSEPERNAVLLRYFERKSAIEIATRLGISAEAAQKRVSRAVERLREFFSKHGVRVGTGGLAIAISTNAVQAAPIGLAVTISAAALTVTTVSTATLAATKTIAMTTLQKTVITATAAVLAGVGIYEARQAARLREQVQTFQQQQASLAEQNQLLQREHDRMGNQLATLSTENAQLKSSQSATELLKLRGELGRLQNATNDPAANAAKSWLTRVNQLKQRLEQNPEARIPELQYATEEDWLNAARGELNTDADHRRALSKLRGAVENRVGLQLQKALKDYLKANRDQMPTNLAQLQSYFATPMDEAILQRWEIAAAETVKSLGLGGDVIITQRAAVDDVFDMRYGIGPNGFGSTDFLSREVASVMNPVWEAFRADHSGRWPDDVSELQPYITTPKQEAALQKLILKKAAGN